MKFIINPTTGQLDAIPSGSSVYPEVNTFADLPAAAANVGKINIVRTPTGIYLINRKEAGLYRSDGANWTRLGDWVTFFNSANLKIYDNSDTSKTMMFVTSGIATGQTRQLIMPDRNIDLNAPEVSSIVLREAGVTPTYKTTIAAADQSGDISYTLPVAAPTSSGQVLSSTTAGVMSWADAATAGEFHDNLLVSITNPKTLTKLLASEIEFLLDETYDTLKTGTI